MRTQFKNNLLRMVIALNTLLFIPFLSHAECSFATFTPASPHSTNPGVLWVANSTFHENNNVDRIIEVQQSGGQFTIPNLTISFDGSVVVPGVNFSLSNPSDGNHSFQISGQIPAGTACNQQVNIIVTVRKKLGCGPFGNDCVYSDECWFTYILRTNQTGSISLNGPTSTCFTTAQNYTVSGSSASQYIWSSSNTNFKINGVNPCTTSVANASIAPNASGSGGSTTITVTASGSGFCSTASSQLTITSYAPVITLTGSPSLCAEVGSPMQIVATSISGATYTWWRRANGTSNWGSPLAITGNTLSLAAQSSASVWNIKCEAMLNGCRSTAVTVNATWCVSQPPPAVGCCYTPGKRLSDPDAFKEHTLIIAPNPSNGLFSLSSVSNLKVITVSDLTGKVVKSIGGLIGSEFNLNLSDLNEGIYIIKADGTDFSQQEKIIIKH